MKTVIEGYDVTSENGRLEFSNNHYVFGFSQIGRMQLEKFLKDTKEEVPVKPDPENVPETPTKEPETVVPEVEETPKSRKKTK